MFKEIFVKAGLKLLRREVQMGFPKGTSSRSICRLDVILTLRCCRAVPCHRICPEMRDCNLLHSISSKKEFQRIEDSRVLRYRTVSSSSSQSPSHIPYQSSLVVAGPHESRRSSPINRKVVFRRSST